MTDSEAFYPHSLAVSAVSVGVFAAMSIDGILASTIGIIMCGLSIPRHGGIGRASRGVDVFLCDSSHHSAQFAWED